MARTKTPANIVGPQIRKRRSALDLTQEELATRCQLAGLDISRGTLSQIEDRVSEIAGVITDLRCVLCRRPRCPRGWICAAIFPDRVSMI